MRRFTGLGWTILGGLVLVLAVVLLYRLLDLREAARADARATHFEGMEPVVPDVAPDSTSRLSLPSTDGQDRAAAGGASPLPAVADSRGVAVAQAENRLSSALSELRGAIEASTYERLDPFALVQAAQEVLGLELSDGAIPRFTDNGEIVVPFLDPPEGVEAHLTLGRSRAYGTVAGLEITLRPREGSNYLDGSVREDARCSIRAFRDPSSQELSRLVLMTNLDPDYRSMKELGLPLDRGSFVMGVTFSLDVNDSFGSTMKAHGFQNGAVTNWQIPVMLDGPTLRPEDARRLANHIYERLGRLDNLEEEER